ncbi:ankyrin repeat domain-containing protein [Actimicrobium sp. CCI2.3]|uniref:ankyrin repeat domain-containing protein n=1 Tax=Actimicrobium sp. CCI2.3 TaxID=3048616 RepID=UPI002AB4EA9E|nr:ankyrin repeat domain-containing protein [Actimicrobium sp. CCI2.3]MDY7574085.1 ankyrin repeat domain-containing protein [Actimicrobium sp. CCI2.3]MEB0023931.1 ankyrin repeat domain-containing protein [Actimicrobium sp. CCI2.3]
MGNCLARTGSSRPITIPVQVAAAVVAQPDPEPARPPSPAQVAAAVVAQPDPEPARPPSPSSATSVLSASAQARWRQVCNQPLSGQLVERGLLRPGTRLDFSFEERAEIGRALTHLPPGAQFWSTVAVACQLGNPVRFGAVETLIRHGLLDPNEQLGHLTLLQMVCLEGQNAWPRIENPLTLEHRIASLIALGADMDREDLAAASLLRLIWQRNDTDGHLAAAALLAHGCDPLQHAALNVELLEHAADRGNLPVIRGLQRAGLALDLPLDELNSTALHLAAGHGYDEILRFLVTEGGVDINAVDDNLSTALHLATENFNFETVRTLLEMQANPNCVDIDGMSPLMVASRHYSEPLRALLIQHGANPNMTASDN